ncbi:hypothetical protein JZ751_027650 [Albula glossodonta]|uniref:Uncharacterized protein n=1 Tax=Albula glossodonta TaxID=121402 RepID=A0A8T2PJV0_9TELE|nr:hypothetical protein JZ751_027650 [Albula glossodonta]
MGLNQQILQPEHFQWVLIYPDPKPGCMLSYRELVLEEFKGENSGYCKVGLAQPAETVQCQCCQSVERTAKFSLPSGLVRNQLISGFTPSHPTQHSCRTDPKMHSETLHLLISKSNVPRLLRGPSQLDVRTSTRRPDEDQPPSTEAIEPWR